jgi:ATP-dependent Zn protease
MGHAFVALLTKYKKVIKVSINLWSPQCLGFTLFEPPNRALTTKQELMCELMVLLGGRVAEEVFFESGMSSSASRDLEYTKKIAEQMVNVLGMGEKVIYPQTSNEYKQLMDKEIDGLIYQAYKRTQKLLLGIKPLLKESAELLVKKRELKVEEIVTLFKTHMSQL